MQTYFIQNILLQIIFLLFYQLFLKKETFYRLNRLYILGSLALSYIIPFIHFDFSSSHINIYKNLEPVIIGIDKMSNQINQNFDFQWFRLIYLFGILLMTIIFTQKLIKIYDLYRRNPKQKIQQAIRIDVSGLKNAFTFMNWIFVDSELPQEHKEKLVVHELVHVQRKHSFDMLFIEVLKMFFWWNPLLYIYQKTLSLLHEYMADNQVLKQFEQKEYFNFMLQQSFQVHSVSFISQFYQKSFIKKRIIMQKKQKSSQKAIIKYFYFMMIAMSMSIIFNACQKNEKQAKDNLKLQKKLDSSTKNTNDKVAEYNLDVDVFPIFPGCKETEPEKIKVFFNQQIQKFVGKNFNTSLAHDLKVKGKMVRVLTQFTIDDTGKIVNIKTRSKYPKLADEAKRVISSLPQFKPAIKDGKAVRIVYTLPIIFKPE